MPETGTNWVGEVKLNVILHCLHLTGHDSTSLCVKTSEVQSSKGSIEMP